MKQYYIRVSLERARVEWNGDKPSASGPNGREKNNAIIATLDYPRPGAPTIVSTRAYDLASGETVTFDGKFLESWAVQRNGHRRDTAAHSRYRP